MTKDIQKVLDRNASYQLEAEKIWRINARLSKSAVAGKIALRFGGKAASIRRLIVRPASPETV